MVKKINEYMDLNLSTRDIEWAHRVGKPTKNGRRIVAKCWEYQTKEKIIKNGRKFAGTKIGVSHDFSERVREARRALLPQLKQTKEENRRATLVYDHLIIEGKRVYYDNPICNSEAPTPAVARDTRGPGQEWRMQGRRGKTRPLTDSASPATTPTKRSNCDRDGV